MSSYDVASKICGGWTSAGVKTYLLMSPLVPGSEPAHLNARGHGGQGESLVPPYTRGSVSLYLTGARVKAGCLLIHAEASRARLVS